MCCQAALDSLKRYLMDDDLIAVETILLQAQDAPKYGVNSRELVLRAARAAVQGPAASHTCAPSGTGQPCNGGPPPDKQQGRQACSGEAAEQLVQSLTLHERPLVQYIARSAVPRIARQGVANRLAGLHLAYLLQRAGLPVSAASLQRPDAAPIRKAGVAAGLAQELNLYRKSNSKPVYMNAAARTPACPSFLPPAAEAEGLAQNATAVEQEGSGHAHERQLAGAAQPAAQQQDALDEDSGRKQSEAEAAPAEHVTSCAVLVEDPITWDAADPVGAASSSGECPLSPGREEATRAGKGESQPVEDAHGAAVADASHKQEEQRLARRAKRKAEDSGALLAPGSTDPAGLHAAQPVHADGGVLAGRQPLEQPAMAQAQPDSRGQEEYSPSHSLDVPELDFFTSGAPEGGAPDVCSLPQRQQGGAGEPEAGTSGVRRATLRFVRAILDPLYQAKVISRGVYKKVLERAVEKVVALHADAPNASFLVDEAGKVQRLVSGYVQHLQERDTTCW